jgi:hypothetical protein
MTITLSRVELDEKCAAPRRDRLKAYLSHTTNRGEKQLVMVNITADFSLQKIDINFIIAARDFGFGKY